MFGYEIVKSDDLQRLRESAHYKIKYEQLVDCMKYHNIPMPTSKQKAVWAVFGNTSMLEQLRNNGKIIASTDGGANK